MDTLDVRGLSCPLPVLKVKKALDKGSQEMQINGSSKISLENVCKYVASQGFTIDLVKPDPNDWNINITKQTK